MKNRMFALSLVFVLSFFLLLSLWAVRSTAAPTTTITVDSPLDTIAADGVCTLREALQAANTDSAVNECPAGSGTDTIGFAPGVNLIVLSSTGMLISDSVNITADSLSPVQIDGSGIGERIFTIEPGVSATLSGLVIRDGAAGGIANGGSLNLNDCTLRNNQSSDNGGAIANNGSLQITNCRIEDNQALTGGGVYNSSGAVLTITQSSLYSNTAILNGGGISAGGNVTIDASAIYSNTAGMNGGGLAITATTRITLTNSTLSGNSAAAAGGGFYQNGGASAILHATIANNLSDADNNGSLSDGGGGIKIITGTLALRNTILAANRDNSPAQHPDCSGSLISLDYNLFGNTTGCNTTFQSNDLTGQSPQLLALGDNGGPTWTHALAPNSPARNHIPPAACPLPTDQRGYLRPEESGCEIGAYEYNAQPPPTDTPTPPPTPTPTPPPTPTPTSTITPTPTPTTGEVYLPLVVYDEVSAITIFFDDFTTGWTPLPEDGASSGIENGAYFLQHTQYRIARSLAAHPALPDAYSVAVTATLQSAEGSYGITFEWQNANQFYVFVVDPVAGTYQLRAFDNGWTILVSDTFAGAAGTTTYRLKVERERSTGDIRLYIDDMNTPIASLQDSTYTNGSAGLEVWGTPATSPSNPTKAIFDDFSITVAGSDYFFDDFTTGWTPLPEDGASSGIENGAYFLQHTQYRIARSLAAHPALPDAYSVAVTATLQSAEGSYGITFERQNANEFYVFVVDPVAGTYQLRAFDNDWTILVSDTFAGTAGTTTYRLKVERERSTGDIRLYIDDMNTPIASLQDSTYTNGSAGLEVWGTPATSPSNPTKAIFDDFQIQQLP